MRVAIRNPRKIVLAVHTKAQQTYCSNLFLCSVSQSEVSWLEGRGAKIVLVNEVDDYSCKATLQSKNMVLEMSLTGPMSIIECNIFFKCSNIQCSQCFK